MDDWGKIERALQALAASGSAEVREDGEWLGELPALRYEMRAHGQDSLVHLWSAERNVTRRLLRVREHTEDRIVLEVQRFGRARPGRLEFRRTGRPRSAVRASREEFRAHFRRILRERFPDAEVDSLTAAPDLEHSFSGAYLRGRMREGARAWAVMAAAPDATSAAADGMLGIGILWLDWTRGQTGKQPIQGLRLFFPEGASRSARERVAALSSGARTELFEFREPDGPMRRMDPADAGNLESWLVPRGAAESAVQAACEAAARFSTLAGAMAEPSCAIRLRAASQASEVVFSFRGLDFARSSRDGIRFGLSDAREKLTASTEPALDALIRKLDLYRSPSTSDTKHPLYRAAPERWIEAQVLDDPERLDAHLDPRHIYPRVPALTPGDSGVPDLLGMTRQGRLVVVELKASEDLQMPLQTMDYWLRVRRHQRDGDFERNGYFPGIKLDPRPPLVWLAAPALRFHPATEILLK